MPTFEDLTTIFGIIVMLLLIVSGIIQNDVTYLGLGVLSLGLLFLRRKKKATIKGLGGLFELSWSDDGRNNFNP